LKTDTALSDSLPLSPLNTHAPFEINPSPELLVPGSMPFNPLKPKRRERERERESGVRKDSKSVEAKRKCWVRSKTHFISGGEKEDLIVRRFPAMPARPSDKDRIGVKTLG
jgi:hypothetical protein